MKSNFRIAIPVEICEKSDKGWKIKGIASTEDRDLQGEIVKQNGLDFSHINKGMGLFNWNHKNDPQYILGKIDNAKVKGDKTVVEGYLFEHQDNAKALVNIMRSLKPEDKGRVQMSIEGKIIERGGSDNKTIKAAKVEKVALTLDPVNPHTYTELVKSLVSEEKLEVEQDDVELIKSDIQKLDEKIDELTKMLSVGVGGDAAPATRSGGGVLPKESVDSKKKKLKKENVEDDEEELKKPDVSKAFSREDIVNLLHKSVLLRMKKAHPELSLDKCMMVVDTIVEQKLEKSQKKPSMIDEVDEFDISEKYNNLKNGLNSVFGYDDVGKFEKLYSYLVSALKTGDVGKVKKLQGVFHGVHNKLYNGQDKRYEEAAKQISEFATSLNGYIGSLSDKQRELSEVFEGKKTIEKSLRGVVDLIKGRKGLPIGTIRTWSGVDYKKVGPDNWVPVRFNKEAEKKEQKEAESEKEQADKKSSAEKKRKQREGVEMDDDYANTMARRKYGQSWNQLGSKEQDEIQRMFEAGEDIEDEPKSEKKGGGSGSGDDGDGGKKKADIEQNILDWHASSVSKEQAGKVADAIASSNLKEEEFKLSDDELEYEKFFDAIDKRVDDISSKLKDSLKGKGIQEKSIKNAVWGYLMSVNASNQKKEKESGEGFYVYDPEGKPTTREPFKTKEEAQEAKNDYLRGYKNRYGGSDAENWDKYKVVDAEKENKKVEEKKKASVAKQEKGFYVYAQDGEPVNGKPFKSKEEAAQAMKDYLEGYKRAGGGMEKLWSIEESKGQGDEEGNQGAKSDKEWADKKAKEYKEKTKESGGKDEEGEEKREYFGGVHPDDSDTAAERQLREEWASLKEKLATEDDYRTSMKYEDRMSEIEDKLKKKSKKEGEGDNKLGKFKTQEAVFAEIKELKSKEDPAGRMAIAAYLVGNGMKHEEAIKQLDAYGAEQQKRANAEEKSKGEDYDDEGEEGDYDEEGGNELGMPDDLWQMAKEMYEDGKSYRAIVNDILDTKNGRKWFEKKYNGNEFNLRQELEDYINDDEGKTKKSFDPDSRQLPITSRKTARLSASDIAEYKRSVDKIERDLAACYRKIEGINDDIKDAEDDRTKSSLEKKLDYFKRTALRIKELLDETSAYYNEMKTEYEEAAESGERKHYEERIAHHLRKEKQAEIEGNPDDVRYHRAEIDRLQEIVNENKELR